ncbi:MAG: hypothetical protein QM751_15155 [Paludibacteraceae bacterium]
MTADLSSIVTPTSRTKRDDESRKTDNARELGVKVKNRNYKQIFIYTPSFSKGRIFSIPLAPFSPDSYREGECGVQWTDVFNNTYDAKSPLWRKGI